MGVAQQLSRLLVNPHIAAALSIAVFLLSGLPWCYLLGPCGKQETDGQNEWWSCILFMLAYNAFPWEAVLFAYYSVSFTYRRRYLHRKPKATIPSEDLPGVSIIKPLMGLDPFQEDNLESHFLLKYPKFELLMGVQNEKDPVIDLVHRLCAKYPDVDAKLFIGGKAGLINPMVNNMARQYESAKYEVIWISSSRIKACSEIILDMVEKLHLPNTGLVFQLPFVTDQKGLASAVEKAYFGAYLARVLLAHLSLNISCITGMSYVFRKADLDSLNGLGWYGRYLMEDFFIAQALHDKGYKIQVADIPAQQNVTSAGIRAHQERLVRWYKLRLNAVPISTLFLEPVSFGMSMGLYMSWAVWYLFAWNPLLFFVCHMTVYCLLDYTQLKDLQNGPLPFSKLTFLLAWSISESLHILYCLEGLLSPRTTTWGKSTYKLLLGGRTEKVSNKDNIKTNNNNNRKSL